MRIALVAPSDRSCAAIAQELGSRATVEVLTTCAATSGPWRNYYDPGVSRVGCVTLRRFRSDYPTVPGLEARLAAVVRTGTAAPELQERWLQECGPYSSALLDHLSKSRGEHDAFVFLPLQSATTVFGLAVVDSAVVAPQIGDQTLLTSELLRSTLARAAGFVFASEAEANALRDLCGASRPSATTQNDPAAAVLDVVERVAAAGRGLARDP